MRIIFNPSGVNKISRSNYCVSLKNNCNERQLFIWLRAWDPRTVRSIRLIRQYREEDTDCCCKRPDFRNGNGIGRPARVDRSNGLNDKAERKGGGNASMIFITTTRGERNVAATKRPRAFAFTFAHARVAVPFLGTAINAPFVG